MVLMECRSQLQQANEELADCKRISTQTVGHHQGILMEALQVKLARYEGGIEVEGVFTEFGTSIYFGTQIGIEGHKARVLVMKENKE